MSTQERAPTPTTPERSATPDRTLRRTPRRPDLRGLLAIPAGVALLVGLDAGLVLLEVWAPVSRARVAEAHGVLMPLGFLGALVALERAVALRRRAALLVPAALALGALLHLSARSASVGQLLLVAGTAGLVATYVPLWRRQRDDAVLVQALGAVLGTGAAIMWRGGVPLPDLVPWLVGFLVLTIAGERLELARLTLRPSAAGWLVAAASGVCAAAGAATLWPSVGLPLYGLALLAVTVWLAVHDVARRTVHAQGLPRFMAVAMLAGQFWLGVTGAIWLFGPAEDAAYDAAVHAAFLGFAMSMVMAHAPVILPAVTGRALPYHRVMYAPLTLLHASLLVRLWGGDGLGSTLALRVGGVLNVLALLLFVVVAVVRAIGAGRGRPAPRSLSARVAP